MTNDTMQSYYFKSKNNSRIHNLWGEVNKI